MNTKTPDDQPIAGRDTDVLEALLRDEIESGAARVMEMPREPVMPASFGIVETPEPIDETHKTFEAWHRTATGYGRTLEEAVTQFRANTTFAFPSLMPRITVMWRRKPFIEQGMAFGQSPGAAFKVGARFSLVLDFDKGTRNGESPISSPKDLTEENLLRARDVVLASFSPGTRVHVTSAWDGDALRAAAESMRYARIHGHSDLGQAQVCVETYLVHVEAARAAEVEAEADAEEMTDEQLRDLKPARKPGAPRD